MGILSLLGCLQLLARYHQCDCCRVNQLHTLEELVEELVPLRRMHVLLQVRARAAIKAGELVRQVSDANVHSGSALYIASSRRCKCDDQAHEGC